MSAHYFEIEIKSLLGSRENAERLVGKMRALDPRFKTLAPHSQLNHYFIGGDLKKLVAEISKRISRDDALRLAPLADAHGYSLRSRLADGKILFVLKVSRDSASSANSTNRIEFECPVKAPTLDELDKMILHAGFNYQAKWSRARQEYKFLDINVTIDKNAGYGYLAEFEVIERDKDKTEEAKKRLEGIMVKLGVHELPQSRLERMFAFYNDNWRDYYGTEKIFVVE